MSPGAPQEPLGCPADDLLHMNERKPESTPAPLDPRMRLAAERTLLAWIRTGLAMMGFGFVVARFGLFLREMAAVEHRIPEKSTGLSLWLGIGLVALGVLVNVLSVLDYRAFLRHYERGEPDHVPRWSLGISTGIVLAGIGAVMIVYLVAI